MKLANYVPKDFKEKDLFAKTLRQFCYRSTQNTISQITPFIVKALFNLLVEKVDSKAEKNEVLETKRIKRDLLKSLKHLSLSKESHAEIFQVNNLYVLVNYVRKIEEF